MAFLNIFCFPPRNPEKSINKKENVFSVNVLLLVYYYYYFMTLSTPLFSVLV
jgi:hypothetical protein